MLENLGEPIPLHPKALGPRLMYGVQRDPHYYCGFCRHCFRFYAKKPDADPEAMNPVDRQNWLTAKAVLLTASPVLLTVYDYWTSERIGLDEAVTHACHVHHMPKANIFALERTACKQFAIRRGLLWSGEDSTINDT